MPNNSFNHRRHRIDRVERTMNTFAVILLILVVSFWVAVIFIVWHFLTKVW